MAFRAPAPSTEDRDAQRAHAGLCADCRHLQLLRSKTSTFIRCALSDRDERFSRYPPLPVHRCPGFVRAEASDPTPPASESGR